MHTQIYGDVEHETSQLIYVGSGCPVQLELAMVRCKHQLFADPADDMRARRGVIALWAARC
jgi:hypothetical protein